MEECATNTKKQKFKVSIAVFIIVSALLLALLIFPFYRKISHFYDQRNEIHNITFHVSQEIPEGSYGHEMRIVNAYINGKKVDLSRFENEDWVWHPEWGYVLYQNGENDFCIESEEPITSFSMEYVKQEGSGICSIELGEDTVELRMYKKTWKNSFLKINFQNNIQKYLSFADLLLLSLIIIYLCYRVVFYISVKNQVVSGVGSSLTMFDFAKGLGMLPIIGGHSIEDIIAISEISYSVNSALGGLIGLFCMYSLMSMFFIASGYGFRKGDIKSVTSMQLKYLLSPYWKVALGVAAVSLLRAILDANFNGKDYLSKLLPFVLFSAHDGSVLGVNIGSVGPIWYSVSLCFAWIILSLVFLADSQLLQFFCVILSIVVSFFLSKIDAHLFCLTQSFAAVPIIYAGYLIRKNKTWTKETGLKRIVYILLAILFFVCALINGTPFSMAVNNWGNNQIVGLLVSILGGYFMLRIMLSLNKPLKGKAKLIKKIGRNSYYVFYIHTFEYLAIPWRQIMQKISVPDGMKIVIIFICRSILIWLIYIAMKKLRDVKINGKQRENRTCL